MHQVVRIRKGNPRVTSDGYEPRDCWRVIDNQRVVDVFRDSGKWWVTRVRHPLQRDNEDAPPEGMAAYAWCYPNKETALVQAGRLLATTN